MPNGETEAATRQALLNHNLQEQARTVNIVPGVTTATLISTSKLADANYTTIFDAEEVNIYNANNTESTVNRGAILKGWRDHTTGLWCIPLSKQIENKNTQTVLCNKPPSELLHN